MKQKKHILYVATHGLGDLIMSLPAIEYISDNGYELVALVRDNSQKEYLKHTSRIKYKDILVLNYYMNLGLIYGKVLLVLKLFSFRFYRAIPQMNLNMKRFNFLLFFAFVKERNLSSQVLKKALDCSPRKGKKHKVDINIEMASKIMDSKLPRLPTPMWTSSKITSKQQKFKIALAPGSGEVESFKRWSIRNYADLSKKIMSFFPNSEIKIYGTPVESELCRNIEKLSENSASFVGNCSVSELYDSLKESSICISTCNGASHVAAHAGANVIVINGPSNLAFTGAFCDKRFEITNNLKSSSSYRSEYDLWKSKSFGPVPSVDQVFETILRILK
jgi:ADP-heptose:LPS heptosyltransferase